MTCTQIQCPLFEECQKEKEQVVHCQKLAIFQKLAKTFRPKQRKLNYVGRELTGYLH